MQAFVSMESVLYSTENNGDKIMKFDVHKNTEHISTVYKLLIEYRYRDC